jgi:hypothetical protein
MKQNGNWEKWEQGEGGFQSMFDGRCFPGSGRPKTARTTANKRCATDGEKPNTTVIPTRALVIARTCAAIYSCIHLYRIFI